MGHTTPQNVIDLSDHRPLDPILRVGDVVDFFNREDHRDIFDFIADALDLEDDEELESVTGIITRIDTVFPDNHPVAPGQSASVTFQIPIGESWHNVENISILHLARLVNETKTLRSGQ